MNSSPIRTQSQQPQRGTAAPLHNASSAARPSKPRLRQQEPAEELPSTLPHVARTVAEVLMQRDPESGRKYVRQLLASQRRAAR